MVRYVFRAPRYPVIVVAGERVFRAAAKRDVDRLVRREAALSPSPIRVLDWTWEWFEHVADADALAPSPVDRVPTKQEVIDLVERRSNRSAEEPVRQRESSRRTREEILLELLERLPRS